MSASPGIMEGDKQSIRISVGEGSAAEIYSQSYEKIHKMENGSAERSISISVDRNALFIFNPLPIIPYAQSAMDNKIEVKLADESSVFIYSDILIAGRIARDEVFKFKFYNSLLKLYQGGELAHFDNTRYNPSKMSMNEIGLYEGNTHLMNMVVCNLDIEDEIIKYMNDFGLIWGITRNCKGYIVLKILADRAEKLEHISNEIKNIAINKYYNKDL